VSPTIQHDTQSNYLQPFTNVQKQLISRIGNYTSMGSHNNSPKGVTPYTTLAQYKPPSRHQRLPHSTLEQLPTSTLFTLQDD